MHTGSRGRVHYYTTFPPRLQPAQQEVFKIEAQCRDKVTSLYLVRHAQTSANAEGRFQGHYDLPLSDTGLAQVELLVRRFRLIPLQAVYTSPLQRARETAQPIAASHGLTAIEKSGLIEISAGVMENRLFEELRVEYAEAFAALTEAPHSFNPKDGEHAMDAFARMRTAAMELVAAHRGESIMIVSHGFVIRCFLCDMLGCAPEELGVMSWGKNTSVSHILFDGALHPTVAYVHDDSHLHSGQGRALDNIRGKAEDR